MNNDSIHSHLRGLMSIARGLRLPACDSSVTVAFGSKPLNFIGRNCDCGWDWKRKPSFMASGWRNAFGNVRSFVGNALGGLRGGSSLASWAVAGTLAYYLWIYPSQQLRKEQEERAASAAASDPYRYVEKRKPIPDPQETGLIYGNKSGTKKNE